MVAAWEKTGKYRAQDTKNRDHTQAREGSDEVEVPQSKTNRREISHNKQDYAEEKKSEAACPTRTRESKTPNQKGRVSNSEQDSTEKMRPVNIHTQQESRERDNSVGQS